MKDIMPPSKFIYKPTAFEKRQVKKILTFLILTFLLTSFFQLSLVLFNPTTAGKENYILGMIWSPTIAALITSRLYQKDLAEFGWHWGSSRYHFLSYITPFFYTLVAYLITWTLGLGSFFNAESLQEIAKNYGWETLPQGLIILLHVVVSGTLGILKACPYALGEEIGWRGFLVPELAKTTTFFNTALISGLAWAIWHYPLIIFGDYNNGTSIPYSLFSFTIAVIAISFPMAWLRLKSGSLWTGMVFHASDNLFIQDVFNLLTKDTGITKYITGEFGIAIALTSSIAAYIYWKRQTELPNIIN
jgi:membrane protease YdiL (CAAX protease family)